ncbi:MAG: nuclear transport factor 2 family protein [Burkholderiales bacterium]
MNEARLALLKQYFESLSVQSVDRLGDIYSRDAYFKDPFNDVRGVSEIQRVYTHMFAKLQSPRFLVQRSWLDGDSAVLWWEFAFRFRGGKPEGEQRISGTSVLQFDADGKVSHHRDYWDPAEGLYEKFPVIGGLMRWLKRRVG